jgi:DNA-binding response OmpR family regulator
LRALHVEDNPLDARFIARAFEEAGYDVAWTRLQRADGALVHVRQTIEPLAVEPGSP